MKRLPLGLCALVLSGCAGGFGNTYTRSLQPIAPGDASILAQCVIDVLAQREPGLKAPVRVNPLPDDALAAAMAPLVVDGLRHRGFAVAEASKAQPGERSVDFSALPLDGGDLVRISIDGGSLDGDRYYARNTSGALQAAGPLLLRLSETAP